MNSPRNAARIGLVSLALALACGAPIARAASPSPGAEDRAAASTDTWSIWGGYASFEWNRELLADLGLRLAEPTDLLSEREAGRVTDFLLRDSSGLRFQVANDDFAGFIGGSLGIRGGHDILHRGSSLGLVHFTLRPRAHDPFGLDLVSSDGSRWLYLDRMLYEIDGAGPKLRIRAMDIRIAPELAERLGDDSLAGVALGSLEMSSQVHGPRLGGGPKGGGACPPVSTKWPGMPVPGQSPGTVYEADVFMRNFSGQYMRKQNADGPGGALDGDVMYTPSSTLINNRNNGTLVNTVTGVAGATPSLAKFAADVPWHEAFSVTCPPYDNDQHPFLVWNLYRAHIVPGSNPVQYSRIEQIGRSGVKHAFLTTNNPCDEHPGSSHILGRGCVDTYSTGNNDSSTRQGPRSEIVPALGIWGRCGSQQDPNCDGSSSDRIPYGSFENRMTVKESQIDPAANPGVHYFFESWYIVRDDIDIFNTMQTARVSFAWNASGGGTWPMATPGPTSQGPAMDRFMPPQTNTRTRRTTAINRPEGQARVSVNVTALGAGRYRYDYAVMNYTFAEAVIITDDLSIGPDNRFRPHVESNDGFVDFELPLAEAVTVSAQEFGDGDTIAGNDWTMSAGTGQLRWIATSGNELDWGTLFRFSVVTNSAPQPGQLSLRTAQSDTPDFAIVDTLVPSGVPEYTVGGTVTGVSGTDGVELALNGGQAVTRTDDGAFQFPDALRQGDDYVVTIAREPTGRDCTVDGGDGTIAATEVVSVTIDCSAQTEAMFRDGFED
jgi:hypothetical protein